MVPARAFKGHTYNPPDFALSTPNIVSLARQLVMYLSTNIERACLVKTTVLLLHYLYFSLLQTKQYNNS